MKKLYCVICSKYRKFKKPKITYLLAASKKMKDEQIIKGESIEILKILVLINNIEEYQKI